MLESIDEVSAKQWNALTRKQYPFLQHEFLAALEHNDCVGESTGWITQHVAAFDDQGILVGAIPLYQKHNSYGEFVFDWSWAEAYERAGLPYYPKLVSAAPYTPATGPRLLVDDGPEKTVIIDQMIEYTIEHARTKQYASLHFLFTNESDTNDLEKHGLLRRTGFQFHWRNQQYQDFDHFLACLNSKKRKKILRERRYVREAGLALKVIHGADASDTQLHDMHHFYHSLYERKWGFPVLNLGFFREISATMGKEVVLALAYDKDKTVAGAFNLRGPDALYGRHWGCNANYHSLHFETCYYQGIEYCIDNKLALFEPGAQGRHKISRGFLPTPTWSAHWIKDQQFSTAVSHFLTQESEAMQEEISELQSHSPFKEVL